MGNDIEKILRKAELKELNGLSYKDEMANLCSDCLNETMTGDRLETTTFLRKRLYEDLNKTIGTDDFDKIRKRLYIAEETVNNLKNYYDDGDMKKAESERDYLELITLNIAVSAADILADPKCEDKIDTSKQLLDESAFSAEGLFEQFNVFYKDVVAALDKATDKHPGNLYTAIAKLHTFIMLSSI